ncbi:hypothetical protein H9P43_006721 [Blastocladiella emersonii ATCC 22665]|nr:hypothetical protein H9P43_006721 [Blastocladiella emersonii ATCC 22665]
MHHYTNLAPNAGCPSVPTEPLLPPAPPQSEHDALLSLLNARVSCIRGGIALRFAAAKGVEPPAWGQFDHGPSLPEPPHVPSTAEEVDAKPARRQASLCVVSDSEDDVDEDVHEQPNALPLSTDWPQSVPVSVSETHTLARCARPSRPFSVPLSRRHPLVVAIAITGMGASGAPHSSASSCVRSVLLALRVEVALRFRLVPVPWSHAHRPAPVPWSHATRSEPSADPYRFPSNSDIIKLTMTASFTLPNIVLNTAAGQATLVAYLDAVVALLGAGNLARGIILGRRRIAPQIYFDLVLFLRMDMPDDVARAAVLGILDPARRPAWLADWRALARVPGEPIQAFAQRFLATIAPAVTEDEAGRFPQIKQVFIERALLLPQHRDTISRVGKNTTRFFAELVDIIAQYETAFGPSPAPPPLPPVNLAHVVADPIPRAASPPPPPTAPSPPPPPSELAESVIVCRFCAHLTHLPASDWLHAAGAACPRSRNVRVLVHFLEHGIRATRMRLNPYDDRASDSEVARRLAGIARKLRGVPRQRQNDAVRLAGDYFAACAELPAEVKRTVLRMVTKVEIGKEET